MGFQWGKATISAKELTIGDEEVISNIAALVSAEKNGFYLIKHGRFAEFQVGAVVDGDWPIPRVTEADTHEKVAAAYDAWRGLSRRFGRLWQAEVAASESNGKNE